MGITEKWTAGDQARLDELNSRKVAWEKQARAPLEDVIKQVFHRTTPTSVEIIRDRMIKNADSLRDALAPFDSGVRVKELS